MEYLTDMVTMVPEAISSTQVDKVREAEALRAAELAKAGHLIRLWRLPLSFSVLFGVRSMNEVFPLERAAEAYDHMMSGKARFRCVLTTGN